jgi:hypothetical protein
MKAVKLLRAWLLAGMAATVVATLIAVGTSNVQMAWAANSPLLSPLVVTETAGCWSIDESKKIIVSTAQAGVGWWDKEDTLTVTQSNNGITIIPKKAVMISIPSNCQGMPTPEDWVKGKRDTGEWVIMKK